MRRHVMWVAAATALGLTAGHGLPRRPAAGRAQPAADRDHKVEGTENVYIFRNGNHQSIFIVTKAGVIATDPGRPTAGRTAAQHTSTRSRRSPTSRSST